MGKDLYGRELGRNFFQRKDGRYEARTVIDGKLVDVYSNDLKALAKEFENAKLLLLRDQRGYRPNLTLRAWYEEWFEKVKSPQLKSEVSRKAYDRRARNTFIRLLGDKKLKYLSQIDIQESCSILIDEENYSHRTVREGAGIVKECLDSAVANKVIDTNPCVGIRIRDDDVIRERRVLTHEEQKIFLDEVSGDYYEEVYKILLLTGMRIGELSGLQWRDVDYSRKVVHIRRAMQTAYIDGEKILELTTPKTRNSVRDIPFFGETAQCFRSWREKQKVYHKKYADRWRGDEKKYGDLVFTTRYGSPVTRYVLQSHIKKVEMQINLKEATAAFMEGRDPVVFEHVHPHTFRHTFATRCFEKGMNPVVVQAIMGHANYSTTLSYTHVLDDLRNKEVEKIGDFLD